MQGLLDYPRNNGTLNQGQVLELIQGNGVEVSFGVEMVWPTLAIVPADPLTIFDISDCIMDGSYVSYDNTAKIGGSCNLVLDPAAFETKYGYSLLQEYVAPGGTFPADIPGAAHAFYWGNPRTRLRPYMTLHAEGLSPAKFYLGVYVPATPQAPMDSPEPVYTVTGYDLTSMLDIPLVNDLSYPAGTNIFGVILNILTQYGNNFGGYSPHVWINFGGPLPNTMQNATTFSADGSTSYLDVVNALLVSISYYPLFTDQYGSWQFIKWVDPRTDTVDWVFDFTDPDNSMVDPSGSWSPDYWKVPNQWRFIQQGLPVAPVEGAGQYTITNQSSGPCSIDRQIGRIIQSYQTVNAASQIDLMNQGTALMIADLQLAETISFNSAPLPLAGHRDIVQVISDNIEPNMFASALTNVRRCAVQSWELPLNGDDMSWVVGTIG